MDQSRIAPAEIILADRRIRAACGSGCSAVARNILGGSGRGVDPGARAGCFARGRASAGGRVPHRLRRTWPAPGQRPSSRSRLVALRVIVGPGGNAVRPTLIFEADPATFRRGFFAGLAMRHDPLNGRHGCIRKHFRAKRIEYSSNRTHVSSSSNARQDR